jgi:hypothetical protein
MEPGSSRQRPGIFGIACTSTYSHVVDFVVAFEKPMALKPGFALSPLLLLHLVHLWKVSNMATS